MNWNKVSVRKNMCQSVMSVQTLKVTHFLTIQY